MNFKAKEKLFNCADCQSKFTRKDNLQKHKKNCPRKERHMRGESSKKFFPAFIVYL